MNRGFGAREDIAQPTRKIRAAPIVEKYSALSEATNWAITSLDTKEARSNAWPTRSPQNCEEYYESDFKEDGWSTGRRDAQMRDTGIPDHVNESGSSGISQVSNDASRKQVIEGSDLMQSYRAIVFIKREAELPRKSGFGNFAAQCT
jgi:hypothetical protein